MQCAIDSRIEIAPGFFDAFEKVLHEIGAQRLLQADRAAFVIDIGKERSQGDVAAFVTTDAVAGAKKPGS